MATFNYAKMLRTANNLIARFGASVAVSRPGAINRVNGNEVRTPASTFNVVGVQTEYKAAEIDGTRVVVGDVKFLCKASPAMQVGDVLTISGNSLRVINTNPLNPAGTVLLYQLQLRG